MTPPCGVPCGSSSSVLCKAPYRDAVNATSPGVGMHLFPCQSKCSFRTDLVDQAEPLLSFQPSSEGRQHRFSPYTPFGLVSLPQVLFRLFIPHGNSRGSCFVVHGFCLSTFLPPFAPRALPRFITTMMALTSARLRSRGFLPEQISMLPHVTFPAFSPQPSTTTRSSLLNEACEGKRLQLRLQTSPVARRLVLVANRIGFTSVWDRRSASGCSPPHLTMTQLPPAPLPLLVSGGLGLSPVDFMYLHSH